MPYKEKELKQVKYGIRQVSKLLKVPSSKIRYWESVFSIPSITTNKRVGRKYSEGAFRSLRNVKRLVDTNEYSLLGIAKKLGLKYLGETVAGDPIMTDINESLVDRLVNDYLLNQVDRRGGKKIGIQKRTFKDETVVHSFFFKRENRHGHKSKCHFDLVNRNGDFTICINALVLVPESEVHEYIECGAYAVPENPKYGHKLLKKDLAIGLDAFMSAVTIFNQILCTDFTNTASVAEKPQWPRLKRL